MIVLPKFQCCVLHNSSLVGNHYLIDIRWALSICMIPVTMVPEHQSGSFLFLSCTHSRLAWFMIVSCIRNTYVCACVCLNEVQHFTELADFSPCQHFPGWDKTGLSIISQSLIFLRKSKRGTLTNRCKSDWALCLQENQSFLICVSSKENGKSEATRRIWALWELGLRMIGMDMALLMALLFNHCSGWCLIGNTSHS